LAWSIVTLCAVCLCGATAFADRGENWPRRYNEGVTAYHSNEFSRAAALFENATASRNRALQQRSFYNLGNTEYRLGQAQPVQAQPLWEHALKSYEAALALDPKDVDAKFNYDFVKKKLDELKTQQQEQQQQQNQNKQQNKNNQQKKDEEKQQPQNSKDQQSGQQQPQQPQQSPAQQKQDQAQKEKQPEQQAQQQKSSAPEQKAQEENGQPEDYDKMQATALLNDLRENERTWNFFPEVQMKDLKDSGKTAKDW